jgi:hypothetical protein
VLVDKDPPEESLLEECEDCSADWLQEPVFQKCFGCPEMDLGVLLVVSSWAGCPSFF